MIEYLKQREVCLHTDSVKLTSLAEDIFLLNYDKPFDFLSMNDSVLSTIAFSLSQNGETMASTHGDHTVKVFEITSGNMIRCFRGHPRTPWTVKYNPMDSNIIASGCLGFEVRIWDIVQGICLNIIRLQSSIITLAFHPEGKFLVISSGPNLHTCDWREGYSILLKLRLQLRKKNVFSL
jgi:WD40 repeat protein